jgi:hypothetical protein
MDANVRSGKASRGYGDTAETFDPKTAYGLDDDLDQISDDDHRQGIGNDNILVWREGDNSPQDFHKLVGRQTEGFEATPVRLGHLITWISESIDSPVLAWWAIRQNGLHPGLLVKFEWQVERSTTLGKRARHIWNLILEHHRDPRNRQWNGEWFDLKKRLSLEGWTASFLREFRRATTPRLEIKRPFGLRESGPPFASWEDIHFGDLGQFDVVFLDHHNENLDVPDDLLPQVFGILEEQLSTASGLLGDIDTVYFQTPTCYTDREADAKGRITKATEVFTWFVRLFDRIAAKWPELAKAHATTWPSSDTFFFRKLKLYALSKVAAFGADQVAKEVLSVDQEAFWDIDVARELLFLLLDRWKEFSQGDRNQLIDRILAGPDQPADWPEEEFHALRSSRAASYARYLELNGCVLTADRSEQVGELISGIPGWSDSWAASIVTERGSYVGRGATDERPEGILDIPVNEVVTKAKEELKRDFDHFTDKRPFTGLVKVKPRKALSALTIAGKANDYPVEFWSAMISELPLEIKPRLKRVFLNRIVRLPYEVITALRHPLSRWIEQNLVAVIEFDSDLGWKVYDHIVDGILSGGGDATKSGIGEIRQGGKTIQRSRRTFDYAINSPVGLCVEALFRAVPGEKQKARSLIPDYIKSRVERLFAAPGEGADHAVSIASRKLNWLMFIDPSWTKEHLIPCGVLHGQTGQPRGAHTPRFQVWCCRNLQVRRREVRRRGGVSSWAGLAIDWSVWPS